MPVVVAEREHLQDTETFLACCMLVNTCHSLDLTSCARLNKRTVVGLLHTLVLGWG